MAMQFESMFRDKKKKLMKNIIQNPSSLLKQKEIPMYKMDK